MKVVIFTLILICLGNGSLIAKTVKNKVSPKITGGMLSSQKALIVVGDDYIIQGESYINTTTDIWSGVNIERSTKKAFYFLNNSITSVNSGGYMLQAGDEVIESTNNNLDGEIITGNKFVWNGSDQSRYITHGIFTGCNINAIIKYNYCLNVPMSIIRKAASDMTSTSGGVAYNIIKNPTAVGVVVKGMKGVNIYNNTFYSSEPGYSGENTPGTWRGLIDIYNNTDVTPNVTASRVKIKNNIFYTFLQIYNIRVVNADCLTGFESDYNIFYCKAGTPKFSYLGADKTFAQWQALGYDIHSVVVDPNFTNTTDLIPASRLDYGTDLGYLWETGLSAAANWIIGSSPETTNQNGKWQVGACLYATSNPKYYVATTGSNSNNGSIDSPWATLDYGFNHISAGDILYVRGGTYTPNGKVIAGVFAAVGVNGKSGTLANQYQVNAYPGEIPVLDCSNLTNNSYSRIGIFVTNSSYWHINGLEIKNCNQVSASSPHYGGQGIFITGSSNIIIENCVAHNNQGPGMGTRVVNEVHFLNCDSYSNFDPYTDTPGDNADGFDIGFNSGGTIRCTGCRSWNNSDDGFDMYQYTGYNGIYYLANCWAWNSGYRSDGYTIGGDGNGFKYGADSQSYDGITKRYTYNSIAYNNRQRGFSQESAKVKKIFYNNISYNNGSHGYSFGWEGDPNSCFEVGDILRNNVSYGDGVENIHGCTLYAKRVSDHNSWDGGVPVNSTDFISVDGKQLDDARQPDGSLPDINFLKLSSTSKLINAGVDVGLPFNGSAPDLGAFETAPLTGSSTLEIQNDDFRVYPNPFNDIINISSISGDVKELSLKLFDIRGIELYRTIESGDCKLDLSRYRSGIYFLQIICRNKTTINKLVKC